MQSGPDTAIPAELRAAWLAWAVSYADRFGYLLKDIAQLSTLAADEPTLFAALAWASAAQRDQETIALAVGLEFYYYVQGWWSRKLELHQHYIAAATRLDDLTTQVAALTMHVQLLCRLNRPHEAVPFLAQLAALPGIEQIGGEPAFHRFHAQALYALASNDIARAQAAWMHILEQAAAWALPDHMQIGAYHWLGISYARLGRGDEAGQLFTRALQDSQAAGYDRWVARNQVQLAQLARARGDLRDVQARLEVAAAHTEATDREQLAHLYREQAWLARLRGDTFRAQETYQAARDLFIRMGLEHEIAAADEQALISIAWGES
jgi:hypothetical protein